MKIKINMRSVFLSKWKLIAAGVIFLTIFLGISLPTDLNCGLGFGNPGPECSLPVIFLFGVSVVLIALGAVLFAPLLEIFNYSPTGTDLVIFATLGWYVIFIIVSLIIEVIRNRK